MRRLDSGRLAQAHARDHRQPNLGTRSTCGIRRARRRGSPRRRVAGVHATGGARGIRSTIAAHSASSKSEKPERRDGRHRQKPACRTQPPWWRITAGGASRDAEGRCSVERKAMDSKLLSFRFAFRRPSCGRRSPGSSGWTGRSSASPGRAPGPGFSAAGCGRASCSARLSVCAARPLSYRSPASGCGVFCAAGPVGAFGLGPRPRSCPDLSGSVTVSFPAAGRYAYRAGCCR